MKYKYLKAVQENGPDYFLVYEGVNVFGATPIARCESQESAKRIVGAPNGTGYKQQDMSFIGCPIAARLTDFLNDRVPVPYLDLQRWIYEELSEIGKEHRLGD